MKSDYVAQFLASAIYEVEDVSYAEAWGAARDVLDTEMTREEIADVARSLALLTALTRRRIDRNKG